MRPVRHKHLLQGAEPDNVKKKNKKKLAPIFVLVDWLIGALG
jgi:hypothetical protein